MKTTDRMLMFAGILSSSVDVRMIRTHSKSRGSKFPLILAQTEVSLRRRAKRKGTGTLVPAPMGVTKSQATPSINDGRSVSTSQCCCATQTTHNAKSTLKSWTI